MAAMAQKRKFSRKEKLCAPLEDATKRNCFLKFDNLKTNKVVHFLRAP
jgi:hypothetical protein